MNITYCDRCGTEIRRAGTKPARFCSISCKAAWQRTLKPVDEAWLRQKYTDEGLSTYEIGAIVGRDPKQVHRWLVGYGIPTRPRGANLAGDDCYMKQPGVVNPFAGREHSEETRKVLSEKASTPRPWLRGAANGMYGKTGEANPRYVDGSSPERQRLYASSEWKALARQVFKRDGYRCQRCGSAHTGSRSLHAHHVAPWAGNPERRFDADNLVTLCRPCHEWVHSAANEERAFLL